MNGPSRPLGADPDDTDAWLDEQDERQALESTYWDEVRALFAGPDLRTRAAVRCRRCQVPAVQTAGRAPLTRRLGRVLEGPTGLVLTSDTPRVVLLADWPAGEGPAEAETMTPPEVRAVFGRRHALTTPDGWILDGPDTVAARLPWWFEAGLELEPHDPPSMFDRPAVVCSTHDRIPVDPAALAVRVRAGASRVDV